MGLFYFTYIGFTGLKKNSGCQYQYGCIDKESNIEGNGAINKTILAYSKKIESLWNIEKGVATESIAIAKNEALTFLAQEREKIMRMSHKEALKELIKVHKIESRIRVISGMSDNGIFGMK